MHLLSWLQSYFLNCVTLEIAGNQSVKCIHTALVMQITNGAL